MGCACGGWRCCRRVASPALCCHVPRAVRRHAGLDFIPITAATACDQSNDVETDRRFMRTKLWRLTWPWSCLRPVWRPFHLRKRSPVLVQYLMDTDIPQDQAALAHAHVKTVPAGQQRRSSQERPTAHVEVVDLPDAVTETDELLAVLASTGPDVEAALAEAAGLEASVEGEDDSLARGCTIKCVTGYLQGRPLPGG